MSPPVKPSCQRCGFAKPASRSTDPEIAHATYRLTALKREKKLGGFCTAEQCLLGVLISIKIY